MDGWMDRWMDGWMNGWIDGWIAVVKMKQFHLTDSLKTIIKYHIWYRISVMSDLNKTRLYI